MSKYNIKWLSGVPFVTEEQQDIIDKELEWISSEIEKASDLIFHTIRLTDDFDKDIIIVDGKDGDEDTLFLTYYENSENVVINTIEGVERHEV